MPAISCPDCISGSINTGTPTGTVTKIHGLPTYVARPEGAPKALIVMIPDVFGWDLPNGRVLADNYAKDGEYLVYLPDFQNGHNAAHDLMDTMEALMSPASWFTTIFLKPWYLIKTVAGIVPALFYGRDSVIKPRVFPFFEALKTDPETVSLKVGAAGFCWGGRYVTLLCQDEKAGLITAGFTAHPSNLSMPDDIENVKIPLSIAIGDVDMGMDIGKVNQAKEILEKKKAGDHECVIMPGAKHGFAVRPNSKDESQVESCRKAEVQAIAWFKRWLSEPLS